MREAHDFRCCSFTPNCFLSVNSAARNIVPAGLIFLFLAVLSQGAFAHCKGKHQTDWPDDANHASCGPDPGGDSGADVKMACQLYDVEGNNVLPDKPDDPGWPSLENLYVDGLEKVVCDTGGTSQPNLSGINLNSFDGGNQKQLQRRINFEFDFCEFDEEEPVTVFCIKDAADTGTTGTETKVDYKGKSYSYSGVHGLAEADLMGLFRHGESVMENAGISVRPYADQDHIQLLDPSDSPYPMAVRLVLRDYSKDTPRVVVSVAGRSVLGDKFQGVLCDIPDQGPAITQDVNVTVNASESEPRFVVEAPAGSYGALCTNIPWDQDGDGFTEPCGTGADASRLCNFHGLVKVKFTMDAFALE